MATQPEFTVEEIRSLVAKGWKPPAHMLEQYRPLLLAAYGARGLKYLGTGSLADHDIEQIIAIMGVLDFLGVDHPAPQAEPVAEAA